METQRERERGRGRGREGDRTTVASRVVFEVRHHS